jgi:hypothetical protein
MFRAVAAMSSAVVRVHLTLAVVKRPSALGENVIVLALTANVHRGEFRERVNLRLDDRHRFN